jgi:hypothetical protein
MFKGRRLLIATKHGKDQVLAPLLEEALGVSCFTYGGFDTDTLGTFSGEVARTLDPVSAAREKCLRAAKAAGCDLVMGSEGSLGPHPLMPFVACDEEILLFLDLKNNLEIMARELSAAANFAVSEVEDEQELERFARAAGFPEHALIDEEMPVVVVATNSAHYEKVISNIQEVKARKGKIIAVVTEGDTKVKEMADQVIEVPETDESLSPLINTIPLQLLRYHIAVMRGCNVDQ